MPSIEDVGRQVSFDGPPGTFTLRTGVKFTDGTDFNGAAVCFNFDRWYNFKGLQQSPSVSYYWSTVFGGNAFRHPHSTRTSTTWRGTS